MSISRQPRLLLINPPAVQRGTFAVTPRWAGEAADLLVVFRGYMDGGLFMHAAKRSEKLLRTSRSTLTLCIEELAIDQRQQLERILNRLAPFGDRISIWVSEQVHTVPSIDSSVFNLILGERPGNEPTPA